MNFYKLIKTMSKVNYNSEIKILEISLEELFLFNKITSPPKKELADLIDSFKIKNVVSSLFIEYFSCGRCFYLHKLLILNNDETYTQVSFVFWEASGRLSLVENNTKNIIIVDSIWESEIQFSNILEKSKRVNHLNYKNIYVEDIDFVNHQNNFFFFPIENQEVFVKYHKYIGKCNVKSMFKFPPEKNKSDNYLLTLQIKDWLAYDFNQIYIHNGCLIGTTNRLNVELPDSELFENMHLFSEIMETESIGNVSKWGILESYNISINKGLLTIFHSYDYYQGDNPRDYQLISKIKLIDLMNYNQIYSTLKVD